MSIYGERLLVAIFQATLGDGSDTFGELSALF